MEHHIIIENGRLSLAGKALIHIHHTGECDVVTPENIQTLLHEALQDEYMESETLNDGDQIWFHGKHIAECRSGAIHMTQATPIEITSENFHLDEDTQHQRDPNIERITVARSVAEPMTIAYLALGANASRRTGTTLDHLGGEVEFITQTTSYALFCDDIADQLESRGHACGNWFNGVLQPLGVEIGYAVLCLTDNAREHRILAHSLRLLISTGYESAMAAEAVLVAARARMRHLFSQELAAAILLNAYEDTQIIADRYEQDSMLRSLLQDSQDAFNYSDHSHKSVGSYVKGLKLQPVPDPAFH